MKVISIASILSALALLNPTAIAAPTSKASCSPNGALICNGPSEFGLCNFGSVTFQSVAAGTKCVNGKIVAKKTQGSSSNAKCSPNGALICDGPSLFGLCNFGSVTFQSVAAGTKCVHGTIVAI